MKKLVLLCILSVFSFAQNWEYLVYAIGVEYKDKKMTNYAVINENGKKVGSGRGENQSLANAEMLKKYFGKYNYKKGYEMDVLSMLGQRGWELISVKGEVDKSNKRYYFKRED